MWGITNSKALDELPRQGSPAVEMRFKPSALCWQEWWRSGIQYQEQPSSMHISNYKGKGGVPFLFLPGNLSLNRTCTFGFVSLITHISWIHFSFSTLSCWNQSRRSYSPPIETPAQKFSSFPHFYCSFGLSCHNRITSHPFPTQYLGVEPLDTFIIMRGENSQLWSLHRNAKQLDFSLCVFFSTVMSIYHISAFFLCWAMLHLCKTSQTCIL